MDNDIYATLRGTRPQLIIFNYILDDAIMILIFNKLPNLVIIVNKYLIFM